MGSNADHHGNHDDGVNLANARVLRVGGDSSMYPSVAAAVDAITALGLAPGSSSPVVILIYPGTYVSTSPIAVPSYVAIRGVAKWFPVQLQNNTTNLFSCSNFNWFQDFVVLQGTSPTTWAFSGNDQTDITIQDVNMYGVSGGQQGFVFQSGATWKRLAIIDCLVNNFSPGGTNYLGQGYVCYIESTAASARFCDCWIDHCFFDSYSLTDYGGALEIRGCQDVRVEYCTLRGADRWNTSIRIELGVVANGTPQVEIRHCYTTGGVSVYSEPGTNVNVLNSDCAGAIFGGASTVHNSYTDAPYNPLGPL